jgi:hypothetical protein
LEFRIIRRISAVYYKSTAPIGEKKSHNQVKFSCRRAVRFSVVLHSLLLINDYRKGVDNENFQRINKPGISRTRVGRSGST